MSSDNLTFIRSESEIYTIKQCPEYTVKSSNRCRIHFCVIDCEKYRSEEISKRLIRQEKKIKQLEQHIEKMKNCGNCNHYDDYTSYCERCGEYTKWEMIEDE